MTGQNLEGEISIELIISKDNKIVKKLINTTQSEFKVSITDASGFEKFLHSLMSRSVEKSSSILIETISRQ
jgi:hypothetical protein